MTAIEYPREVAHPVERCPGCNANVYVNETPWARCDSCGSDVCCGKVVELVEGAKVLCEACQCGPSRCDSCEELSMDGEFVGSQYSPEGEAWLCHECLKLHRR